MAALIPATVAEPAGVHAPPQQDVAPEEAGREDLAYGEDVDDDPMSVGGKEALLAVGLLREEMDQGVTEDGRVHGVSPRLTHDLRVVGRLGQRPHREGELRGLLDPLNVGQDELLEVVRHPQTLAGLEKLAWVARVLRRRDENLGDGTQEFVHPRVLPAQKQLEGLKPLLAISPTQLFKKILQRSSHFGQSAFAEHIIGHGQPSSQGDLLMRSPHLRH